MLRFMVDSPVVRTATAKTEDPYSCQQWVVMGEKPSGGPEAKGFEVGKVIFH